MKHLTLFFYVDALNASLLNPGTMPFLHSLIKDYFHPLENVLGYSFAIQSCMLSGKFPEENNHWMPYFYAPDRSPLLFRTAKFGSFFGLDLIPVFRFLLIQQSRRYFLKEGVPANNIPLKIINNFSLYPYYYMCDLPFFRDLRELLKSNNVFLTYIGPPAVKSGYFYRCLVDHVRISHFEDEFVVVYDDVLDGLGHYFGPCSPEYTNYAKKLDNMLLEVYRHLKSKYDLNFFVFSDHGQCDRKYELNLFPLLNKADLRFGDDYLCFLDATMALFWPRNARSREIITGILDGVNLGTVISENLRMKYQIRFKDERYGDIAFVLKPEAIFFPNFFSPFNSMRGLHGYLPEEDVQKCFLISDEKLIRPITHVKDIYHLILHASGK
jgi:hypothetical protein